MSATIDIRELNEMIEKQSGFVTNLQAGMDQVIVGQRFNQMFLTNDNLVQSASRNGPGYRWSETSG